MENCKEFIVRKMSYSCEFENAPFNSRVMMYERKVNIPIEILNNDIKHNLTEIFKYGQNRIQPHPYKQSVTNGDIIIYKPNEEYLIINNDFKRLDAAQIRFNKPKRKLI